MKSLEESWNCIRAIWHSIRSCARFNHSAPRVYCTQRFDIFQKTLPCMKGSEGAGRGKMTIVLTQSDMLRHDVPYCIRVPVYPGGLPASRT